jgi:Uma2 family endonuclease
MPIEEDPVLAALDYDLPESGHWTTDDLDALPEDGRRREIIDGVLIVSPSPTTLHQGIAGRLMVALDNTCPDELHATQGVEIRISRRRSLTPDVLVVTAQAAARNPAHFLPHEVALAVEIVSPGSVTMDRITKPALFAEAGVPLYWRIETANGIEVHTHRLEPAAAVYRSTGAFTDVVEVDQPWPIRLNVADFTPRRLGGS